MTFALRTFGLVFLFAISVFVFGGFPSGAKAETIPERMIEDLQRDLHLTPFQAAGIAGNLAHETGNFQIMKERGGAGAGYSQWTGARRAEFYSYAATRGGKSSYSANYGFILRELKRDYPGLVDRLRGAKTVEESTRLFMKVFLRPGTPALSRRVGFAKNYLAGNFDGAAPLRVAAGDAAARGAKFVRPSSKGAHKPRL